MMTKMVAVMVGFCAIAHVAWAAEAILSNMDLASDTAWTLRCDEGPARPIKVPGGGWNSDLQTPPIQVMKDVKDYVLYERKITIPKVHSEQAVKLCFGAVAHGCEVFLDGNKVGEHHGPQVPFDMDMTEFATAGKEQTLQVKAYHRRHYILPGEKRTAEIAVGWDFPAGDDPASIAEAKTWCGWSGNSKVGYGIVRSIKLAILPAVYLGDVFVRPSVSRRELSCDVWVRNTTDNARTVSLGAVLASWNKADWVYPEIPAVSASIPAHGEMKMRLGPVPWTLDPKSYWWPNIPFREDYLAQLHLLKFTVTENEKTWNTGSTRFGFVEHAEGDYYYTVNGVRVNGMSDGTAEGGMSHFDAYGISAAFLPPIKAGTGCPETWRRYMRIGINMNRLHCSPPTEYMMEAADEVGFMLIPEAPIWGNFLSRYNSNYTPQTYHDMGRACRNHPSVVRYSLCNEVREPRSQLKDNWPWRSAIDDIGKVDDSRPLVFELAMMGHGRVDGSNGGHAWVIDHYSSTHEKVGPGKGIRGMGEHFWTTDMGNFAVGSRVLRVNDWCYMAGWCWLNYWPNFLEGMSHDLHAWKPQNHADRKDGVDGWGSPIVEFMQRSVHPYLVQDRDLLDDNPAEPRKSPGNGIEWPYQLPVVVSGKSVERKIVVFNGGLSGNQFILRWRAHWDKPDGPVAIENADLPSVIEPGFHGVQTVAFTAPLHDQKERKLYLILESLLDGKPVFRSEETCLNVIVRNIDPTCEFIGLDARTQGDWQGKFGADGYELIGHEAKLPAYAKHAWLNGSLKSFDKATDDKRALAYFADPPTGKDRIAAARVGDQVSFTLDAGQTPRRMTLYFSDFDKKGLKQRIEIVDAQTGKSLGQQDVPDSAQGCYQSWRIRGAIKVIARQPDGGSASISGLFLDADNGSK